MIGISGSPRRHGDHREGSIERRGYTVRKWCNLAEDGTRPLELTIRKAACCCGQLRAVCQDEPVRISVCHCLDCQRRTGSAFGFQARYVHVRRALGFTPFARKTKIHDRSDFIAIERVGLRRTSQNLAQNICASARGIALVACGHETRTHRAAHQVRFTTVA